MEVKHLLLDKKFFESVEEVENILQESDVQDGSLIQTLIFDKEVFATIAEAAEFAATHGFNFADVEETDKQVVLAQFDVNEFEDDSFRQIEIRRGVTAIVGLIKIVDDFDMPDFFLSLRSSSGIKCSENLPHIIELAKVVNGFHAAYGEVSITQEMLFNMESNFKENVVGVDLMIDYDHDQREAAGWISETFLSLDKTTLFGVVKWTPKGALALNDRSFRYFSPEFTLNYVHPHTGVVHGPTLLGGGLVNRPFLKMEAIVGFNNKDEGNVNMETINLKDHEAKVAVFQREISDLRLSEEKTIKVVDGLKEANVKLSEEVKELNAANAKKELETKNEKLFTENKINAAQLVALNEGKDFYEVMALSEKVNINADGENSNGSEITLSEGDKAACKLLGLSHEDYVKYNK